MKSRICRHTKLFNHYSYNLSTQKNYDYIIIGGGCMGASIAYHLASQGCSNIAVIERDLTYKSNSAMLSAGGIRQQFSVPENIQMSMYGAQFIKDMTALEVNGDIPDIQFRENGYLFLAGKRESDREILRSNHLTQLKCGANWIQYLEVESLKQQFPWVNIDRVSAGTYGTMNEGFFDPWLFINAMKHKAKSLGVEYISGVVVGANISSKNISNIKSCQIDSLKVLLNKSSSNTTKFSASAYINAAGAWAGKVVDDIALQNNLSIKKLPVKPRKRCIFNIHCRVNSTQDLRPVPPGNTPLVVDPSGVYFRGTNNEGSFLAGVSPSDSNDPDCDVSNYSEDPDLGNVDTELFQEIIWPTLYELVPAFEELKVVSSWAGYYDYNTLDQNGIIGFHSEIENLMLCNGFSGHGLQQSPAAGRAVSELLLNGNKFKTINLSRFSFERIIKGQPIFEIGIV